MSSTRTKVAVVVAIAATSFGLAAPAFAGSRSGTMTNWHDGDRSGSWADTNAYSSVTFNATCMHDFNARIRHELTARPDATTGSERINCTSYNDAVRSSGSAAGKYHFDVSEYYQSATYVIYPSLSGSYVIKW